LKNTQPSGALKTEHGIEPTTALTRHLFSRNALLMSYYTA
jgi:hypothetical protein